MSTVETGRTAEQRAADYLASSGYDVVGRNWRNRWCELDIIATRGPVLHIIEVKYRKTTTYGYAAEYVNRDKIARLIRAALAWIQAHHYNGPYQIDVISVEGDPANPKITHLENVISA
jgi:putative endonuclease